MLILTVPPHLDEQGIKDKKNQSRKVSSQKETQKTPKIHQQQQ